MPEDQGTLRKPGQPEMLIMHLKNHAWKNCNYPEYEYNRGS